MTASQSTLAGALALFLLSPVPCLAGPCTAAIDQAQARLDARIDARAGTGPEGPESTGALTHRQPTPGSIAEAESWLGEGNSLETALVALGRARVADAAGDRKACEGALAEARQAME